MEQNGRPGDTNLPRAGVYVVADQLRLKAGSTGRPITIKPYNCESVTISGTLRPRSYHVLAGLRIEMPKTSGENWVIRLDGKNLGLIEEVVIRNNTIVGGRSDARRISDNVKNVIISGNWIDGRGQRPYSLYYCRF